MNWRRVQAQENKTVCMVRSSYGYVLNLHLDGIVGRMMRVVGSQ